MSASLAHNAWAREAATESFPGQDGKAPATRLFVAGSASHAGKSTVCLGVLEAAVERYGADAVAYCKAATQDERPDAVARWCAARGVECVSGADCPIVYYAGFTRAFLDGGAYASEDWLDRAAATVARLADGRRVVVIDGVGYPAVGSVCGTSNADVAARLKAPVCVVCKSGVGGAIDEVNFAAAFFAARDVPVLGCVLNKAATTGFYAATQILAPLRAYFNKSRRALYGVVPSSDDLAGLRDAAADAGVDAAPAAAHVRRYVDVDAILDDAARDPWNAKRSFAKEPPTGRKPVDAAALRAIVQTEARVLGASTEPKR